MHQNLILKLPCQENVGQKRNNFGPNIIILERTEMQEFCDFYMRSIFIYKDERFFWI